ncbi:FHA domain-containing protein [Spirosoma endophyticum]|uniref:FHA domain-containing protein n=1 Tax=Spirosoma endophyticum TaxID=662367 RepID=A0A1I1EWS5_9BACT|nr:FHA domain-containing protein [Spirosoma endophyticum]SFB91112.1 FHA domain-containing protein [Spirosoma endophyticum]
MSILDNVKNLFGFTPSQPAPAVNATEAPAEPVAETPKPAPQGPPPAGQRRDQLLRFIVDKLRPYQNEPETTPSGFKLCIVPENGEEEELYRVALWDSQPGKFQKELSRQLADNYIKLPKNWRFEYTFYSDALPDCTYREGNLGLLVLDDSKPTGPPKRARISALVGQTEQTDYTLDPAQKTMFCIGRGHSVQTTSGRVRTNDIVILNDDDPAFTAEKGRGNGAVSRSHATIRYDVAQQRYALLVDPGGLPSSGNKTKVFHPDDTIERADIPGMGYPLQHGDQIELGGEVVLLFELY